MTPEKLIEKYTKEVNNYTHDDALLAILGDDTFPNLIKEAVEMEKQRWLAGGVCHGGVCYTCGENIVDDEGFSDTCSKCFEEG